MRRGLSRRPLGDLVGRSAEWAAVQREARRTIIELLAYDDALIRRDVWLLATRSGLIGTPRKSIHPIGYRIYPTIGYLSPFCLHQLRRVPSPEARMVVSVVTASNVVETSDGRQAAAAPPGAKLSSLSTAAARNLASTTKLVPQMQEISCYPVAVLVPDALGILEGVQVGHHGDAQPVPAPRSGS